MTNDHLTNDDARGPIGEDDPRFTFAKAVSLAGQVIGAVRPDQLDAPTPCPDLEVRSLMGHLVDVLRRVAAIGRDENPFALPPLAAVTDDAWLDSWQQAAHDVQATWSDDAVLRRIVVLPWSQVSGGETLAGYVNEVTVHTWDLAVATGQQPEWDERVLAVALHAIQQVLPDGDRASLFAAAAQAAPPGLGDFPAPFADAVAVRPDSPLLDRLVAWNGRSPQRSVEAAPATAAGRR